MVLSFTDQVLYVDPVGGVARYGELPRPTAVLITHEHGDHFDPDTLMGLIGGRSIPMIANRTAYEQMPAALKSMTGVLANGDTGQIAGVQLDALPAYNITEGHTKYHPEGVGNGYTLTLGDVRIHISGDTEDTPELLALTGIDVLFLPMNQPYTMTPEQAARVIGAVRPRIAYPMHYLGSAQADLDRLVALVPGGAGEVRLRDWYATD